MLSFWLVSFFFFRCDGGKKVLLQRLSVHLTLDFCLVSPLLFPLHSLSPHQTDIIFFFDSSSFFFRLSHAGPEFITGRERDRKKKTNFQLLVYDVNKGREIIMAASSKN